MPNKFCLKDAKYCLVTWSQVPEDFDFWKIIDITTNLNAECIVAQELHEDGGIHYHAFIDFGRKFSSRSTTIFDVDGRHPNIEKVGRTPWVAFDYVTKEGQVVAGAAERPTEGSNKLPSNEKWEEILASDNRDSFFNKLRELAPRELLCSFGNICKYADWRYAEAPICYTTPSNFNFNLENYNALVEWKESNLFFGEGNQPPGPRLRAGLRPKTPPTRPALHNHARIVEEHTNKSR